MESKKGTWATIMTVLGLMPFIGYSQYRTWNPLNWNTSYLQSQGTSVSGEAQRRQELLDSAISCVTYDGDTTSIGRRARGTFLNSELREMYLRAGRDIEDLAELEYRPDFSEGKLSLEDPALALTNEDLEKIAVGCRLGS